MHYIEVKHENENLKIQISAAESTAANTFAENERLQKLLEVTTIIIPIEFIHIYQIKDGLINEGKNEMNLLKNNLSSVQARDPRTTRTNGMLHYVSKSLIKSKTII